MLPDNVLSITPVKGKYLTPDNYAISPLVDYELGGIALQDPSQGLRYQVWKLECVSNRYIFISAPNQVRTLLIEGAHITEVSLAFDQNMRPFVTYVDNEVSWYWWYDTVAAAPTFSQLPNGSKTPRACTDDKRPTQTNSSDIILAYIRDEVLYFRAQRDRYTIEYPLATDIRGKLDRVGMTNKNRVQFKIIPDDV